MTIFDLIALAVVGWSAYRGFNRGAVAELLGLFAVGISAFATIAFLPAVAPIMRHLLHAGWLSAVIAAVVVFAVVFLFLRLLAATITNSLNRSFLGGANRLLGLIFGAIRGVVFLGLFALVFNKATPETLKPGWITNAASYPAASAAAGMLQKVMPKRFDWAGGFGGALSNAVNEEGQRPDEETAPQQMAPTETTPISEGAPTPPETTAIPPASERVKAPKHGYTRRARDSVDALVERSR